MSPNHKMPKYYSSGSFHRHWKFSGIFACAFVIALATQIAVLAGSVTFDDDCSNVQCPTEPSLCPADSLERKPAPIFEELYSPDEFVLPREFYDDVGDHAAEEEGHQYEEVPPQLSVFSNSASTNTSTIAITTTSSTANPLLYNLVEEPSEPHKESVSERTKRELNFDDNYEGADGDDNERMLRICCNAKPDEQLELRRRRRRIRRHSTFEDCECKPCGEMPKCPIGEVAIKTQEAAGTPGDCCPSWACAPKRACDDVDVQPYWRDTCTRCSCYGTKGPELCHDECATLEEQETERTCFTADSLQPMEPGSDWYENGFCTKCHCDNGVRDCVGSLCKPATCTNPLKVPGQCCPQCAEGEENILVAHENSTQLDTTNSTERLPETTSATALGNSTTETARTAKVAHSELTNATTNSAATLESTTASSNTSTSEIASTDFTSEVSTESTTDLNTYQNQSTSTETIFELFNSSTATSEVFSSSTEFTSTAKVIDDIAAEGYFGPISSRSTDYNTTVSNGLTEQTSEDTTWSSQTTTTVHPSSIESNSTESISSSTHVYELDAMSTTPSMGTSSMAFYSDSSTEESTTSTESIKDLNTTSSSSTDDPTSSVSTASTVDNTTSSATVQETSQTAENTTSSSSSASVATTAPTNFTTSSISTSSTTISTTSITTQEVTSTTEARASATSSPYTSTVVASTSTTSSPFASTSPAQPSTTVTYWYTFSTSAPSPPMPQPTVYQPSVRQFFTRPEVRYFGACVFVAFLSICALAVWKFLMPTRSSTRRKLKNRYRTVPSSEATSLSHSPTTSHSSMA